jgi:hypothetical protein
VVEEHIYRSLVGGSRFETLFMHGTIFISDVWCMEWRIPWLAGDESSTRGRHLHTIAPHSHTQNNTADLKRLFKRAFYKWNFITTIQEISPFSTKITTLISTSPIYENRTNIPANQGILHSVHHTSETDIVPCINNVSSLDPPNK